MVGGDIVRTYKDWDSPVEFDGFVKLLERVPHADEVWLPLKGEDVVLGMRPFVFEEIKNYKIEFPEVGSMVWYFKELCVVVDVDKRGDLVTIEFSGGTQKTLKYPFNLKTYYPEGFYDISYNGSYLGYVCIERDECDVVHVCDSLGNNLSLDRELMKVRSDGYEPRAVLWSAQRWLVQTMRPSFPSELSGDVWFRDVGKCEDLVFVGSTCFFAIGGKAYQEKYNPNDFMVLSDHKTHRLIPFYLTTDGQYSSFSEEWDIASNLGEWDEE